MTRFAVRFVTWSQTFSIRVKMMGLAVGMVLLMWLGASFLAHSGFVSSTGAELERRGASIAADVAVRGADMVLTHNALGLHELLRATLANNEDIRYIIILDNRGRVAAHTFSAGFPRDLLDLPMPAAGEKRVVFLLSTEEGLVHDVAVPILDGTVGAVRVGMSHARLGQEAIRLTTWMSVAGLAVATLALLGAYLLTQILARPVLGLAAMAGSAAEGDLSRRAPPGPPDEIGQLTSAFNEMLDRLQESQRVKDELLNRVITAQEDERRRIARELHDETSQAITSLIVGLRTMQEEHPAIAEQAAELRARASATLDEIHSLILELRPRVLDELGLVPALRRYTADVAQKYGVQVEFQAMGPDLRLPQHIETCLYRVVQEALTNVARHSGARFASVVLDLKPNQASAIIEDDGRGFDPESDIGLRSLGIVGMRERAALLSGTLQIESGSGTGTTVYIKLPLKEGPADAPAHPAGR